MEQDVNLGGGPWILLPFAACSILLATLGALALIPKLPGTFQPRTIPQPSRSPPTELNCYNEVPLLRGRRRCRTRWSDIQR